MKGMSGQELVTQADKLEQEFKAVKISVDATLPYLLAESKEELPKFFNCCSVRLEVLLISVRILSRSFNSVIDSKGNIEELNKVLDGQNFITNNAAVSMLDMAQATSLD